MEQEKILILNLLSDLAPELEAVLEVESIEVVSSLDDLGEREPLYVLVETEFDIPEHELIENSRILCFSDVEEINHFLRNHGDAIFNPVFATSDVGKVLLERFFSRSTVVQMETAYDGILKECYSTKFTNPLTVGYYTDIIAKYAHAEKADITGLRTFLSSVASFCTYLTKDKVSWFPVDVDYGMSSDAMIIQVTAPVTKVYKDYVIQSLTDDRAQNPFTGLMEICTKQTHAVDMYYLEKANKLVITGVWLKDQASLDSNFFPTLLINQLYTFEELKTLRKNSLTSKIVLAQEDIDVNYDVIPGAVVETFDEEPFEETKNLLSIKMLVEFIKEYRKTENEPKPEKEMVLRDVGRYLRKYPDQREINKLEQSDREAILKCFNNSDLCEELEETITVVKSSIDKEDFLQTVLDNLTEMGEEEAVSIASGPQEEETVSVVSGGGEEKEVVTKVGGSFELSKSSSSAKGTKDEKEVHTVIKGGSDDEPGVMKVKSLGTGDNSKGNKKKEGQTIEKEESFLSKKGGEIDLGNVREAMRKKKGKAAEELTLGDWEGKKKNITEKVTERIKEIKENGHDEDISTLEEEIMTVFKEELGEDQVATTVVKSLTEDAANQLVTEKLNSVNETKVKLEKEKNEQALALRDEQIGRMKKVLDAIKEENSKLKTQIAETSETNKDLSSRSASEGLGASHELKVAQNELLAVQKAAELKDIAIEKLKESQQTAIENKDKQIEQIQQRMDSILDSKSSDGSGEIAAEMKKVSNENRLLQSQIDVKDRTIENMSKRIEEGSQAENSRTAIELEKLKEQNRVALEAMRAFKAEKSGLEGKLRIAQRDVRQKETELNIEKAKGSNTGGSSSKDIREKDREIQALKNEQNKVNEQNKAINIRCKQLEQKMRFLNAQVESANKGNRGGRGGTGSKVSKGKEAQLALKLKQVETAREKMAMDTQRLSSQLDAKKKESVALTTENNTLKNKLTDLEQKLAKHEKKAA